ncbi:MAG TPA: DNA polymerase III subunit delta' [Nocardioidaceae bacterium]|nr:DNA polymerase III subunit delta' [Nocardioidaceae bacterium]
MSTTAPGTDNTTQNTAQGGVWDTLVGQHAAVQTLSRAVGGHGMTHAWLFTGPPGSGRSNAAMAFAAALQCEQGGCGHCLACTTALAGSHADVSVTRTETAVIHVRTIRELVMRATLSPAGGRWQVMVVEDADRLNDSSGNALLKAIEEPSPRTVWLLCAPTVEDVLPTIRSRCRNVTLSTPTAAGVADFLVRRHGIPDGVAAYAARASQGHIGRARALATDENTRNRRREVVSIPSRLTSLGACMNAAANLVDLAKDETAAITEAKNDLEVRELESLYGDDRKAKSSRAYKAALRELTESQKQRARRRTLDVVDRCLMDLMSVYRDTIALQAGAPGDLVNEELRTEIGQLARRSTPEENLRRIDAIFAAREKMLDFTVPPLLALEAMMLALRVR